MTRVRKDARAICLACPMDNSRLEEVYNEEKHFILKGMAQRCYKNRTQIHLQVRIDTKRAAFARKFCVWPRQHWDLKSSSRRIKQQRSLLCSGL